MNGKYHEPNTSTNVGVTPVFSYSCRNHAHPFVNQPAAYDRFHSESLPVVCMMMQTENTRTHRLMN